MFGQDNDYHMGPGALTREVLECTNTSHMDSGVLGNDNIMDSSKSFTFSSSSLSVPELLLPSQDITYFNTSPLPSSPSLTPTVPFSLDAMTAASPAQSAVSSSLPTLMVEHIDTARTKSPDLSSSNNQDDALPYVSFDHTVQSQPPFHLPYQSFQSTDIINSAKHDLSDELHQSAQELSPQSPTSQSPLGHSDELVQPQPTLQQVYAMHVQQFYAQQGQQRQPVVNNFMLQQFYQQYISYLQHEIQCLRQSLPMTTPPPAAVSPTPVQQSVPSPKESHSPPTTSVGSTPAPVALSASGQSLKKSGNSMTPPNQRHHPYPANKPMKFHLVQYSKSSSPVEELDLRGSGGASPPSSPTQTSATMSKLQVRPELLMMKQSEAARILGISPSMLSKRWREAMNGRKWPYRNSRKLQEVSVSTVPVEEGSAGLSRDSDCRKMLEMYKDGLTVTSTCI